MNLRVLVWLTLLHVSPHSYVCSQCDPHQRHKRQHQNAVQYFDQHCVSGYQKKGLELQAAGFRVWSPIPGRH